MRDFIEKQIQEDLEHMQNMIDSGKPTPIQIAVLQAELEMWEDADFRQEMIEEGITPSESIGSSAEGYSQDVLDIAWEAGARF